MRKHLPYYGQERFVRFFALLPVVLEQEIAWLEFVTVQQEYTYPYPFSKWVNTRFTRVEWDKDEKVQDVGIIAFLAHWVSPCFTGNKVEKK